MSRTLRRPTFQLGLHPETAAYRDRVRANGGSISSDTLRLVDQHLVRPLLPYKNRISGLYPIAGDDLNAVRTQLFGTNPLTLTNFVSSDYVERGSGGGLKGDSASSKYANSQILASSLSVSGATLAVYGDDFETSLFAATGTEAAFAGAITGSGLPVFQIVRNAGNHLNVWANSSTASGQVLDSTAGANTFTSGLVGINTISASSLQLWLNGSVNFYNVNNTRSGSLPNLNIFFFGRSTGSGLSIPSSLRMKTGLIGTGFTDAEMQSIYAAIHAFNLALDRAYHTDTMSYRDRVRANGGTVSASTLLAIDTYLTRPLQALKTKFQGLYPIAGNDLSAARTQLFGSNPLTLSNVVAGDYSESGSTGGIKGGTNRALNTLIPAASVNVADAAIGFYGNDMDLPVGSNAALVGAALTGDNVFCRILKTSANLLEALINTSYAARIEVTPIASGMLTVIANSASDLKLYSRDTQIGVNTTARSQTASTLPLAFLAQSSGVGTFNTFGSSRLATGFVGTKLTTSELSLVHASIHAFNVALNRGFHPDTITYRDRIIANGGMISDATLWAIDNYLVRPLQSIKSKLTALYPIAGSNLNAARTQLFGSNPLTLTNFVAGDYVESGSTGGLKGDGSTKLADTSIQIAALPFASAGVQVYASEIPNAVANVLFGAVGGVDRVRLQRSSATVLAGQLHGNSSTSMVSYTDSGAFTSGMLSFLSLGTSDLRLYTNATEVATHTETRFAVVATRTLTFFALNAGPANGYSAMRLRSASITDALNASELATLYTAVHNFNTALSRAA